MGRQWESADGNLFASTIVRIGPGSPQAAGLAFVTAVAVREALERTAPGIPFSLKWPNDILVGGAKLCGMLLERRDDAVIIGIGINLAQHPGGIDRPVTSIAALGGLTPLPQQMVETTAHIFGEWLGRWRLGGLPAILNEWRAHAHEDGDAIGASLPDGTMVEGSYAGISDDGALKLRLADGSIRAIHAGDIFLL